MAYSQNMTTSNGYIVYWIESYINSQSGNSSNITVRVWCKRTNEGYTTYGNGTVYLNVDGQTRQSSITNSQLITSTAILLHDETYNINHNSDGTKSVYIQAYISHDRFSSSWQGWTYTLTPINVAVPPSAPTNVSLSGLFEEGQNTRVTWSNASACDVQQRFWSKDGNLYTDWQQVEYSRESTYRDMYNANITHNAQQVRVRAVKSGLTSAWVETNWIYHQGIKTYDTNFRFRNIKIWNGSTWVQGYIKIWHGSTWRVSH